MKRYSIFPKTPGLEPHYQMVYWQIKEHVAGVLFFCRDAVGVSTTPAEWVGLVKPVVDLERAGLRQAIRPT